MSDEMKLEEALSKEEDRTGKFKKMKHHFNTWCISTRSPLSAFDVLPLHIIQFEDESEMKPKNTLRAFKIKEGLADLFTEELFEHAALCNIKNADQWKTHLQWTLTKIPAILKTWKQNLQFYTVYVNLFGSQIQQAAFIHHVFILFDKQLDIGNLLYKAVLALDNVFVKAPTIGTTARYDRVTGAYTFKTADIICELKTIVYEGVNMLPRDPIEIADDVLENADRLVELFERHKKDIQASNQVNFNNLSLGIMDMLNGMSATVATVLPYKVNIAGIRASRKRKFISKELDNLCIDQTERIKRRLYDFAESFWDLYT